MAEYRELSWLEGYRVGDDGTFWNQRGAGGVKGAWKENKYHLNPSGHIRVCVTIRTADGKRKSATRYLHRLVLEAFAGPCPEGMECRHLDNDPVNNRIDNLRWGTHRENMEDIVRHGVKIPSRGERHWRAVLDEKTVREIFRLDSEGMNQLQISDSLKVNHITVNHVLCGRSWRHLGLVRTGPHKHRGESHRNAKLTDCDVREIRRLGDQGQSRRRIAAQFGVCQDTVRRVLQREGWLHV